MVTCLQLLAAAVTSVSEQRDPGIVNKPQEGRDCSRCATLEGLTTRVHASAFGVSPAMRARRAPLIALDSLGVATTALTWHYRRRDSV